jgi:hypothetical protein
MNLGKQMLRVVGELPSTGEWAANKPQQRFLQFKLSLFPP